MRMPYVLFSLNDDSIINIPKKFSTVVADCFFLIVAHPVQRLIHHAHTMIAFELRAIAIKKIPMAVTARTIQIPV